MGHPWLPRPDTFQLIRPTSLLEGARVSYLITATHEWDEELIQSEFCPDDVNCILGIGLSGRGEEDTLIWHFDRQGRFAVRSAYQVATKLGGRRSVLTGSVPGGFFGNPGLLRRWYCSRGDASLTHYLPWSN
ncbi:UNVERIFIED_CONTAM: hypothetical protein Slati_2519400 [Sesamum latifolium]|uniref:Uncharacterized protein n=1 Tax=Sesamum latifolium TaxID=2727402 RepID=A0AAW2WF02_9LAMI